MPIMPIYQPSTTRGSAEPIKSGLDGSSPRVGGKPRERGRPGYPPISGSAEQIGSDLDGSSGQLASLASWWRIASGASL
jgi:hypothetical protein